MNKHPINKIPKEIRSSIWYNNQENKNKVLSIHLIEITTFNKVNEKLLSNESSSY